MAASKAFYAVVAGVGAGTGRSVALRFARAYPVLLLARRPESYRDIVAEIRQAGGQALGVSADVSDAAAVASAFSAAGKEWPEGRLVAAIYNTGAGWSMKPFLEQTAEALDRSLSQGVCGLFNFAQEAMPRLLSSVDTIVKDGGAASGGVSPSLIITGSTASVRGSARFGAFAAGEFAVRGLGQSLAREFGPRGVHVAHVVIDGIIDGPRTKGHEANAGKEDGKLAPESISEAYWYLHTQHRSAFTQELDLRPWVEKF